MVGARPVVVQTSLVPGAMLVLASAGGWRYGFFILPRWVVGVPAVYLGMIAYGQKSSRWMWAMVIIAVLFNPLIPVSLRRDTWQVLDLLTAVAFVGAAIRLQQSSRSHQGGAVP